MTKKNSHDLDIKNSMLKDKITKTKNKNPVKLG